MCKVLLADDHEVVRQGLKLLLAEEPHMAVGGEASTGHEVLELVRQQAWDVVVLDITMPGKSGLDLLKELKHLRPNLAVLVLTMHQEDQYADRMLKAGARGYLTKGSAGTEVVKAIRTVCAGGVYVSDFLAGKLAVAGALDVHESPHESLSDREFQVLTMIASGKTATEIAEELSLSVKTVSTYRTRILEKMRMHTSAELTHYAISKKLVD